MAYRLMHLFEELNRLGTTVVIATHNSALVNKVGHPCFSLNEGILAVVEKNKQKNSESRESEGAIKNINESIIEPFPS